MYRSASMAAIILALSAGNARAADDPRALIERALRASGDGRWQNEMPATYIRLRGTPVLKEKGMHGVLPTLILEMHLQPPARMRLKLDIQVPLEGRTDGEIVVVDGATGWRDRAGAPRSELSSKEVDRIRSLWFLDRGGELPELLRDKRCTFTALGESKIDGKEVRGVKVACKGREDTLLYFDKTTGLLTRVRYAEQAKAKAIQITFLDYRPMDTGAEETALLKKAGLDTTGPALIAWLRKQRPSPGAREKARKLVRQLGDDTFEVRERASKDLPSLGAAAVPVLEEASRSQDAEIRRRARSCLKRIKERANEAVSIATAHLLALRRPAGAAKALLDYLPTAPAPVAREIRAALYHLGAGGDRPDPDLVAALKDADPVRRAAAAAALGKDGGIYARLPNRRIFRPGLKWPRTIHSKIGDDMNMKLEIQEQRFYNRFDDSLFAAPTPNKP